jgi:hypothetical protein
MIKCKPRLRVLMDVQESCKVRIDREAIGGVRRVLMGLIIPEH